MTEETSLQKPDPKNISGVDYNPYKELHDPYRDVPVAELPGTELSPLNPKLRRCTARSKRKMVGGLLWPDNRCSNPCAGGAAVCAKHGASGGRPVIHSRYSDRMVDDLAERLEAYAQDPQLLDLQDNLATLTLQLSEQLSQMHEYFTIIKQDIEGELDAEGPVDEVGAVKLARIELGHKKLARANRWFNRTMALQAEYRKTATEKRKYEELRARFLTMEEMTALVAALAHAARDEITDPAMYRNFMCKLGELLGKKPRLTEGE